MANITQSVPNFLGGVSTRPDDLKDVNQVRDIVNGYLDPTFGLIKRNGFSFIKELGTASNFTNGYWFFYRFSSTEAYIGVIRSAKLDMWNIDGTAINSGTPFTSEGYLTLASGDPRDNFHTVTRKNQVVVLNKTTTTEQVLASSGTITGAKDSIANLPTATSSNVDDVYRITNTSRTADDFYVKSTLVNGSYVWQETVSPQNSIGLNASTMPHVLTRTALNTFTFGTATYVNRGAGDDDSNPNPSFVGQKISHMFFASNRLGFLSEDSVSLSVTNDFFNFYAKSAQVQVETDPVDLIAGGLQPVTLSSAIPVTQGVLLFGDNQQFMLFSDTGVISPSTSVIKHLSNYEQSDFVLPVETGTNVTFVNKTSGYMRVVQMYTQGSGDSPSFIDIGKEATQYIPDTVQRIFSNAQNYFVGLYGQASRIVYFNKNYIEGDQSLVRGWYSWELPGNVQFISTSNDVMYAVVATTGGSNIALLSLNLNTLPTESQISSGSIITSNPSFDFISTPKPVVTNIHGRTGVQYINGETRIYTKFELTSGLTPICVQDISSNSSVYSGLFKSGTAVTTGTDSLGSYFAIAGEDLSALVWLVGYALDFSVDLPRMYYRSGQFVDNTAYLNIHRVKLSLGLSGQCLFDVTTFGDSSNTVTYETPTLYADNYLYDRLPVDDRNIFSVPILQKNINVDLKIKSSTPYILSLNSLQWEGNYSPRFYQRS